MKDQLKSSKGFLKDKLGGYQVDPPEKVWDSISTLLGGRSRKGMIIIALSVAATIALAIILGINYFGPDMHEEAVIADTGAKETGRETLEERVITTLEELATKELATEDAPTKQPAIKGIAREESATRETGTNELAVHLDAETATDQIAITLQTIEETGMEPSEDQAEEVTGTEPPVDNSTGDKPGTNDTLVLDTGDELPTDPVPDLEMDWKKDPRWIIGAALSPLYSFRDAEATAMKGAAEHESGTVSYAAGVHVGFRTASRLTIESGLYFNKMGIDIGASGIQFFNQSYDQSFDFAPLGAEVSRSNVVAISNSVGNIVSKSGDIYVNNYKLNASYETNALGGYASTGTYTDQGIRQHLDYLEVPFNLRYSVVDRVIELQLVGGLSTNLLVNNYVTMETSDGPTEIGYMTNIKNVNYSGNAGLGLIYHIQKQFSLHLEPRFRYFLNSVNDGTLPSTRPYTFAIFTGLSYTF